MRFVRDLCVCLLLLLNLCQSQAQTAIMLDAHTTSVQLRPYIDLLEDPSSSMDFLDIESDQYSKSFNSVPGKSDLNFGYSESTYWLRLKLGATADAPGKWLLEVGYPSLDRVELYTRQGDQLIHQTTGDLQSFATRAYPHRNLVFPVDIKPGTEQNIYLRVRSEGSLTLPLKLWSTTALHTNDQGVSSVLAMYFGMLLALGLYNLLLSFSLRERIYLSYVATVSGMIIAQASIFGLGNQFIGIRSLASLEIIQFDEFGPVDGQFEIENVVAAGEEGDAARFGLVEIGVDTEHHLLVDDQHLGLVLRDVGVQLAPDLAGEITQHLVHQFAHDVADLVRGVRADQILLVHAHVEHVALVQFDGGLGREVQDHQTRKAPVEQDETADVRLQAGLLDSLHHAGILDPGLGRHPQHITDGITQANQEIVRS